MSFIVWYFRKMEKINDFIEIFYRSSSDIIETSGYAKIEDKEIIIVYSLSNSDCLFDFSNSFNEVIIKINKEYFKKYNQNFNIVTDIQEVCCNTQSKLKDLLNCGITGIARIFFLESIVLYLIYQIQKNNLKFQVNCDTCSFINNSTELDKIIRAKEFIVNNLDENLTIPILANLVGTNQCYLKKGFKEVTGKTIFEFVQDNRMEKAKYLLQNPGKSMADIAFSVGYSSESSFRQSFKNYYGISPASFSKK